MPYDNQDPKWQAICFSEVIDSIERYLELISFTDKFLESSPCDVDLARLLLQAFQIKVKKSIESIQSMRIE